MAAALNLSAILQVVTDRPERLASAAEAVGVLGREWPGIQIHLVARAVGAKTDKPTACADAALALATVATDWIVWLEDDVALGAGFADAVRASVARMMADPGVVVVALFHCLPEGPPGFVPVPSFRQSQALVLSLDGGLLWLAGLRDPHRVTNDWDIVLRGVCCRAGKRIEALRPALVQHRCLPSVCGHPSHRFTAPTFVG